MYNLQLKKIKRTKIPFMYNISNKRIFFIGCDYIIWADVIDMQRNSFTSRKSRQTDTFFVIRNNKRIMTKHC